ncbi:MAG: PAS domain S-box protein [Candidatus Marinimicrobia bacterium]|nr:PAS domain S-box protein [Candidatus Neomarinimicrobiota bacterium]MBL7047065.1 PAS domain S-box protein [Candidatus Neomarinimicrobiota bacterium]
MSHNRLNVKFPQESPLIKKPVIPDATISKWQRIVDLMAELVNVPAGLIMKVDPPQIEVFVSSKTKGNPYEKGERADLDTGLYCETVMEQRGLLLIPDAREDPNWDHNPDIKLGMVSYLGFPIEWPDGEIFGTICVLDNKKNPYSSAYKKLVAEFKGLIDTDLEMFIAIIEHKEIEELKEHYRTVSDFASDWEYWINPDGSFKYLSPSTERITGYKVEEFYNDPSLIEKIVLSEDQKIWDQHDHKKRRVKELRQIVFRIKRKDGTIGWIEHACRGVTNTRGTFLGFRVCNRDITEREQAKQEVRASKEYSSNLIESSLDMIIAVDNKRKITEFNQAAEKTFGYTKEEIIGKHVNLLYANPREGLKVHKQTILNGQHVQEIQNQRKNGEIFPTLLSASVLKDPDGKQIGVMGVSRDITERKRAEEELAINEEKFRTTFEETHDPMYITSQDGEIIEYNKAWCDLFGYARAEFKQISAVDLFCNAADRKRFHAAIVETGHVKDLEIRYRKKDGTEMICLETATVRQDQTGKIIGYQGIIRDMTEKIKTRKKLEKALEDAQKADRLKTLFLANMSHEIRTPLASIIGYSNLIQDSLQDKVGPEELNFFDIIRNSSDQLLQTIHAVLDLSQIEAMSFEVKPERFDLSEITEMVVSEFYPKAKEKNLYLNYNADAEKTMVKADKYCIQQSLSSLLDNAIMYTEEGGISVDMKQKDTRLILTVEDTGIGISKEYQKELFDIFSQESVGYTKRYQGIGLGLALTKRYLSLNGISIKVDSTKGVGTQFTLTFTPIQKPKPIVEKEKTLVQEIPITEKKGCILIVEDDQNAANLFSIYLRRKYDMCFAVSVVEAKQQLKEQKVDLVLLDLSLIGDEDGLDLTRFMRQSKQWKIVPIIAVTAHAFTSDREKCLQAGCNDYLAKPIRSEKLLEMIKAFMKNN